MYIWILLRRESDDDGYSEEIVSSDDEVNSLGDAGVEDTTAHTITSEELTIIEGVMNGSVAPGTQKVYDANWKKWTAFVGPRGLDIYLASLNNDDRVKLTVLFAATCKAYKWDFSHILSSMKHQFAIAFQGSAFLADPSVHKAATSVKPTTRDQAISALDHVKLLLPYDMVLWIRENYFQAIPVNLTSMMTYLATAISYTFGFRFSNVGHDSNVKGAHAITAQYVTFSVSTTGVTVSVNASELPAYLFDKAEYSVTAISFTVLSSKSVGRTALKNRPNGNMHVSFTLSKETGGPCEIQLITDIELWVLASSRLPGDLFFSYRNLEDPSKVKKLVRKEMSAAIKQAAVGCNLDPARFSTKSNRQAHATELVMISQHSTQGGQALNKQWSKESTAIGRYIGNSTSCPNTLTSVDAGTNQSLVEFHLGNAIVLSHGVKKHGTRTGKVHFSEEVATNELSCPSESTVQPAVKRVRKVCPQPVDENSSA